MTGVAQLRWGRTEQVKQGQELYMAPKGNFWAFHESAVLRYFFCANSLAATSAREKSKIDAGATSPFKLAVEVSIAM